MIVSKLLRSSPKPVEFLKTSAQPHMAGVPYNPNGFFGNGTVPPQPVIVVRAEEALIVVLVLALWIAAIALFFNRWGKIRMLEPYQPKFIQQHRPSCPLVVDQVQHRSFSKFNINNDVFLTHQKTLRPRQNSVFVGSSMMNLPMNSSRKVKSAFDLQNLVLSDPALNKSSTRINSRGDYFRRSSLFPVYPRKSIADAQGENPQYSGERRLSFKDLVDIERAQHQRCERVLCHLEKEPAEVEIPRKPRKIGETKPKSTMSNQSSLSDSRHNSITIQDLKPNVLPGGKFPCHDRRNSLFPSPAQREFSPSVDSHELRPEVKSGVNNFRRNSMLLINSLGNERNFLNPRESIKSGVIDFRRNSMLIINNLTEDIGYRPIGRNYSLGGSNVVLNADVPFRRNSVIPPYGYEPSKKLSVPHVSVPKPKTPTGKPSVFHATETKHLSTHKPSKSLDCGDAGKTTNWRSKKEASQPSLLSDAKQKFLTPTVPQNFVGSSASLNADFVHRENNKSIEESRSTGDLNSDKSDFVHPKIIETKCYSPGANDGEVQLKLTASCEDFRKPRLGEVSSVCGDDGCNGGKEAAESKATVDITASLTNLNITCATPLNVVTSSDSARKTTNAVQSSLV